jgi:hypothetical protein
MHIQSNAAMLSQSSNASADNLSHPKPPEGSHPPGPPPGGMPPGLEKAVDTLSNEQKQSVQDIMQSLSDDDKTQLKQLLDEFKLAADNMSLEDIGQSFFDMVSAIANPGESRSSSLSSDNEIDIFV